MPSLHSTQPPNKMTAERKERIEQLFTVLQAMRRAMAVPHGRTFGPGPHAKSTARAKNVASPGFGARFGLRARSRTGKDGISFPQTGLLFALRDQKRFSNADLAAQFNVSPSAITQLVQPLQDEGLVERATDPTDRRITYIQLSKKGNRFIRTLHHRHAEHMYALFDVLDNTELEQLTAIANKLAQANKNTKDKS